MFMTLLDPSIYCIGTTMEQAINTFMVAPKCRYDYRVLRRGCIVAKLFKA